MSPLAFYWLAHFGLSHLYAPLSLPSISSGIQVSREAGEHMPRIRCDRKARNNDRLVVPPTAAGLITPEYLHTIYQRVALQTFLEAALCSRPPLLSSEAMAARRLASGPGNRACAEDLHPCSRAVWCLTINTIFSRYST